MKKRLKILEPKKKLTASQAAFLRSSLNRAHSLFCCIVSSTFQMISIPNPKNNTPDTIMSMMAQVGKEVGQSIFLKQKIEFSLWNLRNYTKKQ